MVEWALDMFLEHVYFFCLISVTAEIDHLAYLLCLEDFLEVHDQFFFPTGGVITPPPVKRPRMPVARSPAARCNENNDQRLSDRKIPASVAALLRVVNQRSIFL